MTEAQHADLPEDEDVTAADRLIIDSPTATGLIVLKALAAGARPDAAGAGLARRRELQGADRTPRRSRRLPPRSAERSANELAPSGLRITISDNQNMTFEPRHASEAKQSMPQQSKSGLLRRCAPRNDVALNSGHSFAISPQMRASFTNNVPPLKQRAQCYPKREQATLKRAQGMPGARCARSLACKSRKHASKSPRSHRKTPGIPRAMVLTVSFALSPVTGLVCHRR